MMYKKTVQPTTPPVLNNKKPTKPHNQPLPLPDKKN